MGVIRDGKQTGERERENMKQSWVLLGAMHSREEIQNKQTHAHESVAHSIELHERHGKETKREREKKKKTKRL